jgi:hypothetical protein
MLDRLCRFLVELLASKAEFMVFKSVYGKFQLINDHWDRNGSMWRWISKKAYKIAKKIIAPRCSVLYMPWHKNAYSKEQQKRMAEIRKISNRIKWGNSSFSRKNKLIVSVLIWPVRLLGVALFLVAKYGKAVRKEYKIGKIRQYFELVYLANRYNIDMDTYYQLRLFLLASWDDAVLYLNNTDGKYLLPSLCNEQKAIEIHDKLLFYKKCKEYDLSVPPIYAYFNSSSEEWLEAPLGNIPPTNLFIKWTNCSCGRGAQLWKYCPGELAWKRLGISYKLEDMISYCRNRSQSRPLILQPGLTNHPQIGCFSLGGLCTVRVVTCRLPNQESKIICAGLRMPEAESIVDNLAAGGLVAGIDPQTGSLSAGEFKDIRKGCWNRHPNTNRLIRDQKIHNWRAIAGLCIKAHESFKEPVFIGWDVIVTPGGTALLEAHSHWCLILAQKALGNSIGSTSFPNDYIKAWKYQQNVKKPST